MLTLRTECTVKEGLRDIKLVISRALSPKSKEVDFDYKEDVSALINRLEIKLDLLKDAIKFQK